MTKPANQADIFERLAELGGIQAQEGAVTIKNDVVEQLTGKLPKDPNLPNSEKIAERNFTPLDTGKMEANFKEQHDNPALAAARAELVTESQVKPDDQIAFSRFRREEKTFHAQQEQEEARAKRQAEEDAALKKKEEQEKVPEYTEPTKAPKRKQGSKKANIESSLSKGA